MLKEVVAEKEIQIESLIKQINLMDKKEPEKEAENKRRKSPDRIILKKD